MRYLPLALFTVASLVLSGCASYPHVVPGGGAPQAVGAAAGASLTVVDQEWEGEPDDLGEYVTPVPVELYNAGPAEVRVSYFDFALADESGFRYKALNPFVPASAQSDTAPSQSSSQVAAIYPEEIDPRPVLLAGRGVRIGAPRPGGMAPRMGGGGGFRRPAGVGYRGAAVRGGVYMGWRAGYGSGGWVGYRVFPYYRPWLGAGFGYYWTDPFFWPPGYAAWVLGWSPMWYPRMRTVPQDVVNLGLPEGVLQAGGHVAGYVYFQRSNANARHLVLTWDIVEARQGTPLGQTQVRLEVVN